MRETPIRQIAMFVWQGCPYACDPCVARTFTPVPAERAAPASAYADWYQACPAPVERVVISGGEPSCHPELSEIMEACPGPVYLNTNLFQDLSALLSDRAVLSLGGIVACPHWHSTHPNYARYWANYEALIARIAQLGRPLSQSFDGSDNGGVFAASVYLYNQMTDPDDVERNAEDARAHGVHLHRSGTSYAWNYRHWGPERDWVLRCSGGHNILAVRADGEVYRCQGYLHVNKGSIGNIRDGWGFLADAPELCAKGPCILAPDCEKVDYTHVSGTGAYLKPIQGIMAHEIPS